MAGLLLRYSVAAHPIWLARTLPPALTGEAFRAFDHAVEAMWCTLLKVQALDERAKMVVRERLGHGGCGLRSAASIANEAHWSSVLASLDVIEAALPSFANCRKSLKRHRFKVRKDGDDPDDYLRRETAHLLPLAHWRADPALWPPGDNSHLAALKKVHNSPILQGMASTLAAMHGEGPRSYDLPLDTSALFADFYHAKRRARSSAGLQRKLVRAREDRVIDARKDELKEMGDPASLKELARIHSTGSKGALAVDATLPTERALRLSDAQWISHQRLRLGLVDFPHDEGSAETIARHDRLVRVLAAEIKGAGFACNTEVLVDRERSDKRMDIVTDIGAGDEWIDVTVVNYRSRSYYKAAAGDPRGAAAMREKAKERRWGRLAEENKTKYSTFAVESSGSMPPYSLLDRIATAVVDARHRELDNDPIDLESGYGKWLVACQANRTVQRVAIALARGNHYKLHETRARL